MKYAIVAFYAIAGFSLALIPLAIAAAGMAH